MPSSVANVLVGVCSVKFDDVDLGWTSDGVTMTVTSELFDVKVEEVIGVLDRVVTDQSVAVALNMAEGTLTNMSTAIPGSVLDSVANTLTVGGGALQSGTLTLVGKNPAGKNRTIDFHKVNPTGEVGVPYKKAEISIVPVTFSALVNPADGKFLTVTDATT